MGRSGENDFNSASLNKIYLCGQLERRICEETHAKTQLFAVHGEASQKVRLAKNEDRKPQYRSQFLFRLSGKRLRARGKFLHHGVGKLPLRGKRQVNGQAQAAFVTTE